MPQINGVVLGAGGARGFAHIGALQVLQENNIPIDLVVGCSAGAIAGALLASGQDLERLERLFTYPGFNKRLLDVSVSKEGLIKGDNFVEVIRLLTRDATFADLPIPLAIVATDLESGELKVFREGSVAQAVRASISIPGFFKPYRYQERMYVDGAVKNRLPVHIARQMGADKVLAIDVKKAEISKFNSAMDVLMRSVEIMEEEIFQYSCRNADYLLRPDVSHIGTYQFEKAQETIDIGKEAVRRELGQIVKIFSHGMEREGLCTIEDPSN